MDRWGREYCHDNTAGGSVSLSLFIPLSPVVLQVPDVSAGVIKAIFDESIWIASS